MNDNANALTLPATDATPGLTWLAVSMTDGSVIAELKALQCSSVETRMMETVTRDASLPWDDTPTNWQQATTPGAIALLLIQETNPTQALWGGVIVKRTRDITSATIDLKISSIENYLDACPVGNDSYINTDQNQIVAQLITKWAINGMRNIITVDTQPSTTKRDDTDHTTDDNKSVLSCIQALANLNGGPEWYCSWELDAATNRWRVVVHIADRIGSETPVIDLGPESMSAFSVEESWENGYGANRVQAYSSADGDAAQPVSSWHDAGDTSRPVIPYRWQPSTSISNVETLESHAESKLAQLKDGTNTISMSLDLETMPRLGVDWRLGDMIRWDMSDAADRLGEWAKGVTRLIGYQIDLVAGTVTPYLQNDGEV